MSLTPREQKIFAILERYLKGREEEAEPLAREFLQQLTADREGICYEIRTALRNKGPLGEEDLRLAVAGAKRETFDEALDVLLEEGEVEDTDEGYIYEGEVEDDLGTFIDERIQPFVAQHGGTIKLVEFDEGTVYVELGGGCQGCAAATLTLHNAIEEMLDKEFGDLVEEVVDTTDHEAGTNPYYDTLPNDE